MRDKCEMVNLPSLLGRDDSRGGLSPRVGAGSGARTGMVLGLGRSSFISKTQMEGQHFSGGKKYQQKYDTFKSVYHPDSENDVKLACWNASYLPWA